MNHITKTKVSQPFPTEKIEKCFDYRTTIYFSINSIFSQTTWSRFQTFGDFGMNHR